MICPNRCGEMSWDIGPRDEPDADGKIVIEAVHRCEVCGREVATHREPWAETEIREAVAAVLKQRSGGVAQLDVRDWELRRGAR